MHKGGSSPPLSQKCNDNSVIHNLKLTIMTKEIKAFITLIVSLIVFTLVLPFNLVIVLCRVIKGLLNVTEKTLTFFIESIRKEILK